MPDRLDSLDAFHPAVANWFRGRFDSPTEAQAAAWPSIRSGRHTLIAAPTGSGKTLAAFLAAIDDLVRQSLEQPLDDAVQVVYVSPLKALSNDIRRNLERLGEQHVTAHHGSLSREQRFDAEQRLKEGRLLALVATASLELGIDIGSVELVCTIGSTRSIATLLQRVGRSGHTVAGLPKGRIFPTTRDELVECAALLAAVGRGELERLVVPEQALDILSQQIVAAVACEEWTEDGLFALVRGAFPYRELPREAFNAVVRMLADGFSTRRGRRGALLHHDEVHRRLRPRRGARLAALTSGGAIPDRADYRVILQPEGTFLGTVDEDFAIESLAGDVFQLGNSSWRIQRVEQGRVLVESARGQSPSIPFWLGEAPGRSPELSSAVARLREEAAGPLAGSREEVRQALEATPGIGAVAAEQIADYLGAARLALGRIPTQSTLVLERFFDEAGNQHLVIHAPFGSRLNRAWGLALRKRFCRSFNFELQAAATEDAIVLSLGPTHSFPAAETFRFLHSSSVREVLVQALLDAPMFGIRWRWNAGRALALLRWRGGRKVPPRLQRMEAEDLIAVVFPDQLACLENIVGEREIPDHPLVGQTIRDCLEEAMDVTRLESLLLAIEAGTIELVSCELREPSPLAHEILNARPYAFLDDAPLEERRTQAVQARRWLDPQAAADLGRLDAAAIERVRAEVRAEPRDADELHDLLVTLGFVTPEEAAPGWPVLFAELVAAGRATSLHARGRELWVAAERLPQLRTVHAAAVCEPALEPPLRRAGQSWTAETALVEIVRGRLESAGPVTADVLAQVCAVETGDVDAALARLEAEGFVMQGSFTPGSPAIEWCERRLLARIHRHTLERLRREIEPLSPVDFMRFLLDWQRVDPDQRAHGAESLGPVLEQLEGFETPAAAWEGEILPARLARYDPLWLDALCLAGRVVWGRGRGRAAGSAVGSRPIRTTSILLCSREGFGLWSQGLAGTEEAPAELSSNARSVLGFLETRGASFFAEILPGTGLLQTQVEEALAELVAAGHVTSDSFTGLRALLTPSSRRPPLGGRRKPSTAVFGMEHAGRWSRLPPPSGTADTAGRAETMARALLRRYGVVCRTLLERESLGLPWRDLLPILRRLEARGEIRGGRFVDGLTGEQFALPEAVGRMRSIRRRKPDRTTVSISAADPLNLLGILMPGPRVPAIPANRLLYRDGLPIAVHEGGEVRFLVDLGPADQWEARNALLRRRIPPQLRAYLGRPA